MYNNASENSSNICQHNYYVSIATLNLTWRKRACDVWLKVRYGKGKAQIAGAYPGFISMKHLGVLLFPPGWDASP